MTSAANTIPTPAFWLGWSGVIPFAALSAIVLLSDPETGKLAGIALGLYGAAILSFMGGAQWGLAIAHHKEGGSAPISLFAHLGISVLPALIAWAATLMPITVSLGVLAVAFAVLLGFDLWTVRRKMSPGWYGMLRIQLTSAVVVCLLVAAFATRT